MFVGRQNAQARRVSNSNGKDLVAKRNLYCSRSRQPIRIEKQHVPL